MKQTNEQAKLQQMYTIVYLGPIGTILPSPEEPLLPINERSKSSNNTTVPTNHAMPLGLMAFALSMFIFSASNAAFRENYQSTTADVLAPVILFYSGLVQFVAGSRLLFSKDAFAGMIFVSYGVFSMSFATFKYFIFPNIKYLNQAYDTTGLCILLWFAFLLPLTYAAFSQSKIIFNSCIILNTAFYFLIIGYLTEDVCFIHMGGYLGIIIAFGAWCKSINQLYHVTSW